MKKYAKDKAFQLTMEKHDFLKAHAEKVEQGDFKSERSSYLYFYDFLRKVLGYKREENILFEDKEAIGRGKVEFVLKSDDNKFMVIELKDQTTDLDKAQSRANDKGPLWIRLLVTRSIQILTTLLIGSWFPTSKNSDYTTTKREALSASASPIKIF
jgi:hypothetical protein